MPSPAIKQWQAALLLQCNTSATGWSILAELCVRRPCIQKSPPYDVQLTRGKEPKHQTEDTVYARSFHLTLAVALWACGRSAENRQLKTWSCDVNKHCCVASVSVAYSWRNYHHGRLVSLAFLPSQHQIVKHVLTIVPVCWSYMWRYESIPKICKKHPDIKHSWHLWPVHQRYKTWRCEGILLWIRIPLCKKGNLQKRTHLKSFKMGANRKKGPRILWSLFLLLLMVFAMFV